MSHLELHGPGGTTQSVKLPKSGSLLVGSDAVCDVQILDVEVQAIHARLKVQGDKLIVEATPEGKSVKLNGKRVAQGNFSAGDELVLGAYRIVFGSGDFAEQPQARPVAPVTPKKAAPAELVWTDIPASAPAKAKLKNKPSKKTQPGQLLAEDVAGSEASQSKSLESPKSSLIGRLLGRKKSDNQPTTVAADTGRGLTVFADDETAGRKLATAPLIVLLSLTLCLLCLTAFGLWWFIDRTRANRAYDSGIALYDAGDFKTSSERFQSFLKMQPNEERSSTAKVLDSLSRIRGLSEGSSPQLNAALTLAAKELPGLVEEPAWKDRQMNAAEVVATLTRDLAARAKQTSSAETVALARSAYRLHSDLAGDAAEAQRSRLKVDQIMAEAEAAVAKGEFRNRTLATMDQALKNKDTLSAFQARDTLLASYPDLLADSAISKRLESANEQVKDNVQVLKLSLDAQKDDPVQTLGPPATVFTRTGPDAAKSTGSEIKTDDVIVISGAGLIVGLDKATGQVLWQKPSGAEPGFEPLLIPEETPPSVLAYDDRDKSLTRLAIEDGKTIWRQRLDDLPNQQPVLLGNRIIVALPAQGILLWLDLATGAIRDGLELKWPLAGSVVVSSNNQTLYVPADQSVLFVLKVEPKSCLKSVYLGHKPGTMRVRPVRSGRFLMFPEQRGLKTGVIQTWLLDDGGTSPQRLQQEPLEGWPVFSPGQQGNLLWASHDRGGFSIFSIGDYTLAKPLSEVGKSPAIEAPSHATNVIAVGQREALVVDRTMKHFRLEPQSGKLTIVRSWNLPDGELVSPIQKIDDNRYILVQSVHRNLGRAVTMFDIREEKPVWQTSWGTPMELADLAVTNQALKWIEPFGQSFQMDLKQSDSVQKFEWNTTSSAINNTDDTEITRPVRWNWHDRGEFRIALADEYPNRILIRKHGEKEPRSINLPVETRIPPILIGEKLIVAGSGGEISVVSSIDGAPIGQPFIPDYEKSAPWHWVSLVGLEDQSVVVADKTGRLIRLLLEENPTRLRQTSRVQLDGKFAGTMISTGRAVLAGLSGGSVISLAGRDLSTQATWTFPGSGTRTFPLNNTHALICHPSGLLRLVDSSGQTQTETTLTNAMPFGTPILKNDTILWLTQNRQSELIFWNIQETQPKRFGLNTWVMGPLIPDGESWIVVERPGIVRRIPPQTLNASAVSEKPLAGTAATAENGDQR